MRLSRINRKLHRWIAVLTALPLVVILMSGVLLQFKKKVPWIQPATVHGIGKEPFLSFQRILETAQSVPEGEIRGWDDIDRLDVRPANGIAKVRAKNDWEIQIDSQTGEILQVAFRRSDLIEDIHDGSFFHESLKLWLFLPVGVILLFLWVTGIYLFLLPYLSRARSK